MTDIMAKIEPIKKVPPLADLREDTIAHLESIKTELEEADKDLEALEKIGINVAALRERVEWGKKARTIILQRFGKEA